MLQPKRTKFRKQMTGHNRGLAQRGSKVSFGEFALKSVARGRLTARQIESARRALTRHVKTWRQDLDSRIPGQAGYQEASRSADG